MSEQKITGIDLAKMNFYLFSINAHGKPAGKIKFSRDQLPYCLVQQPKMTVSMELAGHPITGSGKSRKTDSVVTLSAGHDVILFPAQHVKAYHQKNEL